MTDLPIDFTALTLDDGVKVALYRDVRLNCTFVGGIPTHFRTAESDAALSGATWRTYDPASLFHTFASETHGQKTVYVQLKNDVSETAARSADIIYKPEHPKPEISSFSMNAGAWSTENHVVTLDHIVTNAVPTCYSASENPLLVGKEWLPHNNTPSFTLSRGTGLKEVYLAVANDTDTSETVSARIWLVERVPETMIETEASSTLKVNLYPNPVETVATVEVEGTDNVAVSVYDITGRLYLSRTFSTQLFTLDLTNCPSGVLLVRVSNNANHVVKKIIKK